MSEHSATVERVFQQIAGDGDDRVCRDIPDSACREEPRNFLTHVAALTLSKSADGLVDPKLVLSWLLTSIGAPAAVIGLLVPVREAGALLPQLFTAGAIRRLPRRKYVWAAGSAVQGLAVLGILACALFLDGATAGWGILACLAVLALARSACSVAYKDVLGKTISKSRRGSATGLAGSISAATVIVFALLLVSGWIERMDLVLAALAIAAGAWLLSAAVFVTLEEEAGATEGGANALDVARDYWGYLTSDRQLQRFILSRALLTATALAPPFMVAAWSASSGDGGGQAYAGLGFLVLASALASLLSSWFWGRLADRSSRKVLAYSGLVGAAALLATGLLGLGGGLRDAVLPPVLLFILMVAYQGVRLGRSTHLVDMAGEEQRAAYTALSNTLIGLVLLGGGAFSLLASATGPSTVLLVMAGLALLGGLAAFGLEEVQQGEDA
ncbi:MAG: MFS transporter [Sphingomonadaceae bacterium]|nr:MFS transporter [Sphingomonadaceae bacterium]